MGAQGDRFAEVLIFSQGRILFQSRKFQMRVGDKVTREGALVFDLDTPCLSGTGKKMLRLLPRCFYAVDISGSRILLHHRDASAGDISLAAMLFCGGASPLES